MQTKLTPKFTQPEFQFTKYCECGCGLPAPIAKRNETKRGIVKGQPSRFITGHNSKIKLTPIEVRFWRYVQKTDSCWLWTGGKARYGYGAIGLGGKSTKRVSAHRLSYEMHYGPIPDGLDCLHKCDNPPCVRPDHLFLGTAKDNTADMIAKGRANTTSATAAKGERHGMVKLTEEQVLTIRAEYAAATMGSRELAAKYRVSRHTIQSIVGRKAWKHIGGHVGPVHSVPRGEKSSKAKFTEEQVLSIRAEYAMGNITMKKLAARYGVLKGSIMSIIHRKSWRHI